MGVISVRARARARRNVFVLLAVGVAGAILSAAGAFADHVPGDPGAVVGGFEIDGDLVFPNAALAGDSDWDTVADPTVTTDPANSDTDDTFGGGSKEEDPTTWTFDESKPQGKADLTRVYFANDVTPTTAYLWLGFERLAVQGNGDVHVDFELNASTNAIPNGKIDGNGDPVLVPERTEGDLLIVYNYPGGTNPVDIDIHRWSGTALNGTWGAELSLPSSSVFADINAATIVRPEKFGGGSIDPRRFGEVGLDIDTVFGDDFPACPGFASFWAKSRASGESFTANLSDKVGPVEADFSSCGSVRVLKTDDQGNDVPGATFELLDENGDPTGLTCTVPAEGDTGGCTITDVAPGTYFLREASAPEGWDADPMVIGPFTVGFQEDVVLDGEGQTFVNHKLQPDSALDKAVRNITIDGAFASSTDADPGDAIEYRLCYTNNGDGVALDVVVSDEIPSFSSFTGCTGLGGEGDCTRAPAEGTGPGTVVSFDLGDVAAGGSVDVFFRTILQSTFPQNSATFTNVATADTQQEDPVDSNEATVNVSAPPASDLDKAVRNQTSDGAFDTTATAVPGDVIEYQLIYSNDGTGPASNVTITEEVPDHSTFLDCSDACSNSDVTPGSTITWALGEIGPGTSTTVTFRVQLDATFGASETTILNVATVTTDQEGDTDSNEATVTVDATPLIGATKSVDPTTASIGDTVSYTITYSNTGNGPGDTGEITDTFDAEHLDVDEGSIAADDGGDQGTLGSNTITWASRTIGAGESVTFTYSATVMGSFDQGDQSEDCPEGFPFPVLNSVTSEAASADALLCVSADPVFTVEKTVSQDTAAIGDSVTYTITVTNTGDGPGSTTATDDYDQNHLTITDAGGGNDDDDVITFQTGTLNPGQDVTFTYTATIGGTFDQGDQSEDCPEGFPFPVLNSVSVDGDSDDATVCVEAEPTFDVEKAADPTQTTVGGTVTYTITVTNTGDGPGSTTATDDYDQNHLTITDAGGGNDEGDVITFQTGTLNPGDSQTFTYSGTITGPFTADEADPEACPEPGTFPVVNTVTVEQAAPEGGSDSVTVCVTAAVESALLKEVRNVSDEGEFGPTTTGDLGETLEYRITYANNGDAEATGVVISDEVPAFTTFVSCEPMLTCSEADGVVTWNVGSVPGGSSVEVTMLVQLDESFPAGITSFANVATSASDQEAEPTDSNEVIVSVTVFSKASCPEVAAVPGGLVTWTMDWGVHGRDLTGVTITDTLPDGVEFQSATPTPTEAPAVGESGSIIWSFGEVTAGTTSTVEIVVGIRDDASEGTVLTNTAALSADGIPATETTDDVIVSIGDSANDARAYGASLTLLNTEVIPPTPDTDPSGEPGALAELADPISGDVLQVDLLKVSGGGQTDETGSRANALATTGEVRILDQDPGPDEDWLVTATAVRAVSSSNADKASAGSTFAGTKLVGVTVAGQNIGTVTEPTTVEVTDPVLGTKATVSLIEVVPSGAAEGIDQPVDRTFHSDMTVNAIHVNVVNGETTIADLVVGHASSSASFVSGLLCDDDVPHVSGRGYALGTTVDEGLIDPDNTLVHGEAASVFLPTSGGEETSTLAHVGPLGDGSMVLAESNAAFSHTIGSVDNDANTASAFTESQIEDLDLFDGAIQADLVRAESRSDATAETGSSTGSTTLVGLQIGGNDVCDALGLNDACTPAPNTTIEFPGVALVILNEQVPDPSGTGVTGLTVNAIHVIVLGGDVPVGAEVIVSSAHSGARAAGATADPVEEEGTEALATYGTLRLPSLLKPTGIRSAGSGGQGPTPAPVRAPIDKELAEPVAQDMLEPVRSRAVETTSSDATEVVVVPAVEAMDSSLILLEDKLLAFGL